MYASPANEHWYVAAENGPRQTLLLGPYPNHSEAAKRVTPTRLYVLKVYAHDIYATFATFGVGRVVTDNPRPGKLNGKVNDE